MPSEGLNTNRFALVDKDAVFDTVAPKGKGPGRSYSLDGSTGSSTCGCSCEQILALSTGKKEGEYKFGCSIGIMDTFMKGRCEVDGDRDGFRISNGDCDDSDPLRNPGASETCNGIDDNCDGLVLAEESDADGDGYRACQDDCDDTDPARFPSAPELCDGLDNDCNSLVPADEADGDDDGYRVCEGDCDDDNAAVYPSAPELCDGLDNDCDGEVSPDETDADNDGFSVCDGDCDDADGAIHPGAEETCNGIDDNCDGTLPDDEADADSDGYMPCESDCDDADAAIHPGAEEACNGIDDDCDGTLPLDEADADDDGYSPCGGDCNDTDATIHPGAEEACNGVDDDCDGTLLEDEADQDGDGYRVCEDDCADSDAAIHPGAEEVCDGIDNNCDGVVDEGFDTDSDGFTTCAGDCNDADGAIHPGAEESCDDIDNDCNGIVDEGFDGDGDGFSVCRGDCDDADAVKNPGVTESCDGIDNNCNRIIDEGFDTDQDGYTTCAGDCNDGDLAINPGSAEICDQKDNDCDTSVDEDFDGDQDGYPSWYSGCGSDCDDCDALVHPGATEDCDDTDNDCDGEIDEDVQLPFYADGDGDGIGGTETVQACSLPEDASTETGDCDDTDPLRSPEITEICDGKDNDCDNEVDEGIPTLTFYRDGDGDGSGGTETTQSCLPPAGYVDVTGDCDDTDAGAHPMAEEICDGKDNNCNGETDEFLRSTFYRDDDGDGFGDAESIQACEAPPDYGEDTGDCDDTSATVHPGATEVCDDLDNDCDTRVDEELTMYTLYRDADGDGFGNSTMSIEICSTSIPGYVEDSTDCDDADAFSYPGAAEYCDGMDNDCDGQVDEGVMLTFYPDGDGDGSGGQTGIQACTAPAGYVGNPADCDDTNPAINPTGTEVCDDKDNDCDGQTDEGFLEDVDKDGYSICNNDCNDANREIHPGATDIACDSIDQDCDEQDDCPVRFKDNLDGTILDTTTGLIWLRDANCTGPSGFAETWSQYPSTPPLVTLVNQLAHGKCGLTDQSQPGTWRIPTMAEMKGLFAKEYCKDAVWGYPANSQMGDDRYSYICGPNKYTSQACSGCLGNTAGTSRYLSGDPFIDVMRWSWDKDGEYYTSDPMVPCTYFPQELCQRTVSIHWYHARYFSPPNRPDEWYFRWDQLTESTGFSWGPGYVWPVRDTLVDSDGDTYFRGPDCNDFDPTIYPGAPDDCNGIDRDCDGLTYEGCDRDGDGYTPEGGDCVDTDASVNPGAAEACDGRDNDCDGQMDEGVTHTFYRDADGDGYGGAATTQACTMPAGYVANSGDCNDGDAGVNPNAPDPCDGKDNNCDGVPEHREYYFQDQDGDGYGDISENTRACSLPPGYSTVWGDCDDTNPAINPEGTEVCDSKDNNCNGQMDEGLLQTWYVDADGDGFGGSKGFSLCSPGPDWVTSTGDCNDIDKTVYPGATEYCDKKDNDCDGTIDESEGLVCRFIDQGDGTILDTKTGLYWLKDADCLPHGIVTYEMALESVDGLRDGMCGLSDGSWAGNRTGNETKPKGYTFAGAWRLPTSEEMMGLCGYCGYGCYLPNAAGTGMWKEGDPFTHIWRGSHVAYWTATPAAGDRQVIFTMMPPELPACSVWFSMDPHLISPNFYYMAWPVREAIVDNDQDGFPDLEGPRPGPDCDDTESSINPGAVEVCTGINTRVDENCYYSADEVCDWDNDAFTPLEGECNDDNADIHPQRSDPVNGVDDNCDGRIDERFSTMGDGTVLDNAQGKRWLQDPAVIPPSTWEEAKALVAGLGDGTYGLTDGSEPGDWKLPTRAEFDTLVDRRYAYNGSARCPCEVYGFPKNFGKCWLEILRGPALSNAQGDRPWKEGDPFSHIADLNPECGDDGQDLCSLVYSEGTGIWPIPPCMGVPDMCNRNMFWTSETRDAYDDMDWDEMVPVKDCHTCSHVWSDVNVDSLDPDWPWEYPEGTCCVAYEMNRGGMEDWRIGYWCGDKLKVWPWRPA